MNNLSLCYLILLCPRFADLGDFSRRSGRRGRRRRSYSETPSSSPSPPPKNSKKSRQTESEFEKYESTFGPDNVEKTPPPPSEVTWQRRDHGRLPPGAVYAGRDSDDGPLFVGRFLHEGHLLPAKISPIHECAYSGLDGSEISSSHYEVSKCTKPLKWKIKNTATLLYFLFSIFHFK